MSGAAEHVDGIETAVAQEPEQTAFAPGPLPGLALAPRGGHEVPQLLEIELRDGRAQIRGRSVATRELVAQPLEATLSQRFASAGTAHCVERLGDRIGIALAEQTRDVPDLAPPRRALKTARINHRDLQLRPHGHAGEIVRSQGDQGIAECLQRERFTFALRLRSSGFAGNGQAHALRFECKRVPNDGITAIPTSQPAPTCRHFEARDAESHLRAEYPQPYPSPAGIDSKAKKQYRGTTLP